MEKRISATRAVRDFSQVLNTIKFKGVHYIIERGGKPIYNKRRINITVFLYYIIYRQRNPISSSIWNMATIVISPEYMAGLLGAKTF